MSKQIGVFSNKCIGVSSCSDCIATCSIDMFTVTDNKITAIDRNLCTNCTECYKACPSDALKQWGREMSVAEAMEIIRKDKSYYLENNGGVTISGGEALLQPEFVREVFESCQAEGIHTCVETALHVKPEVVSSVLAVSDMVITDIKHLDPLVHKRHVGASNEQILENIKMISKSGTPLIIRVPIIPGFNDDREVIADIGRFVVEELDNKIVQMQLLRFRPLGQEKYESLGIDYKMEIVKERSQFEQEIQEYAQLLRDMGIAAYAGATQKINI